MYAIFRSVVVVSYIVAPSKQFDANPDPRTASTARMLRHRRDHVGGAMMAKISTRAGPGLRSLQLLCALFAIANASHAPSASPSASPSTPTSSPTSAPTACPTRVITGDIILPATGANHLRHDYDDVAEVSGDVVIENSDLSSLVDWFPILELVTGNVQVRATLLSIWVASATMCPPPGHAPTPVWGRIGHWHKI